MTKLLVCRPTKLCGPPKLKLIKELVGQGGRVLVIVIGKSKFLVQNSTIRWQYVKGQMNLFLYPKLKLVITDFTPSDAHLWLMGFPKPYKSQQSWYCTFLKVFSCTKIKLASKNFFHLLHSDLPAKWYGQFSLNGSYWPCCTGSSWRTL